MIKVNRKKKRAPRSCCCLRAII